MGCRHRNALEVRDCSPGFTTPDLLFNRFSLKDTSDELCVGDEKTELGKGPCSDGNGRLAQAWCLKRQEDFLTEMLAETWRV